MSAVLRATPLAAVLATLVIWAAPAPAAAGIGGTVCSLTGLVSGIAGKLCTAARHAPSVIKAGGKLLGAARRRAERAHGQRRGQAGRTGGGAGSGRGRGSSVARGMRRTRPHT